MQKRLYAYTICILIILGFNAGYMKAQEHESSIADKAQKQNSLTIALIPEKNIIEQRERYKGLVSYLAEKLDLDVRIDILPSYGDICDAFLKGDVDAGFFGSFSYILTQAKVGVIPIARPVWPNGSSTYCGYIFVRKDSGIKTVEDMKGKDLVLVHRATTAGYIFPLKYFKDRGISNLEDYFSNIYFSGSHDVAAWTVYTGEASVGACKNHIFNALVKKDEDFRKQMLILAKSVEVPSNGLAVRRDLDPVLIERLQVLLLTLDKSEEGRKVLEKFGAQKFIQTTEKDYETLYNMSQDLNLDLDAYPYKD